MQEEAETDGLPLWENVNGDTHIHTQSHTHTHTHKRHTEGCSLMCTNLRCVHCAQSWWHICGLRDVTSFACVLVLYSAQRNTVHKTHIHRMAYYSTCLQESLQATLPGTSSGISVSSVAAFGSSWHCMPGAPRLGAMNLSAQIQLCPQ